jgi:hypothetical protein
MVGGQLKSAPACERRRYQVYTGAGVHARQMRSNHGDKLYYSTSSDSEDENGSWCRDLRHKRGDGPACEEGGSAKAMQSTFQL